MDMCTILLWQLVGDISEGNPAEAIKNPAGILWQPLKIINKPFMKKSLE